MKNNFKNINIGSPNKNNSIKEAAEDFIREVVPPFAPPNQANDMMMAFMAGALSIYSIQISPDFASGNLKEVEERMMKMIDEIIEFFDQYKTIEAKTYLTNIKRDLG